MAEIGFSIKTSNPKFSADIAFSWCIIVGVEIITPSTLVDFFNSLRSSNIDILLLLQNDLASSVKSTIPHSFTLSIVSIAIKWRLPIVPMPIMARLII